MIKLYGMTLLALVCASSISVDAKGAANHPYYGHDEFHPHTRDTGETGEAAPDVAPEVSTPAPAPAAITLL